MSALLPAWPLTRPDLLAVSLLMLIAATVCLAAAATRTRRRETPDRDRDTARRRRGRRIVTAALLSGVVAASLAPGTAAYACTGTSLGVCVQTPTLGSVQIPTHITTLGGTNNNNTTKLSLPNIVNLPGITTTNTTNKAKTQLPTNITWPGITTTKPTNKTQLPTIVTWPGNTTTKPKTSTTTKTTNNTQIPTTVTWPSTTTTKPKTTTNTKTKTPLTTTVTWPSTTTTKTKSSTKTTKKTTLPTTITWPSGTKTNTKTYCEQHPQDPQCVNIQGPVIQPPVSCPVSDPACAAQPANQTCQLTEAEQQQLIQDAMAQHAANEQLYQQLLLKALLDQAALKAGSVVLSQHLAGHTGLSPQDIADLIKNGTVGPSDMAMAALQAAQELDQHTGGHSSQNTGTTCGSGGQQQGQGGNATPGNSQSNSNQGQQGQGQGQQGQGQQGQGQQGQGQGQSQGQQGPARVTTPVPGLYQSIDPHNTDPFPGWHFETSDPVEKIDPKTGNVTYEYTTDVTYTNPNTGGTQTSGWVTRTYDPATNTLTMDSANVRPVDSHWVPTDPPMVTGRVDMTTGVSLPDGTPLERYMTMSQMKLIEEKFGPVFDGDYTIKMSTILNDNTVLKLHQIDPQLTNVNQSIQQTQSYAYARDTITQRGGTVANVKVDTTAAAQMDAQDIVGAMDGGASQSQIDAMLNRYGVTNPQTQVTYWFDIYIKVHGNKAP